MKRINNHSLASFRQILYTKDSNAITIPKRTFDLYLKNFCIDKNLFVIEHDQIVVLPCVNGCAITRECKETGINTTTLTDCHIGQYEADIWYPLLTRTTEGRSLTFDSRFIKLTDEHLECLVTKTKSGDGYTDLMIGLDECFHYFAERGIKKVFVKLNSVSPKDLCAYSDDPYGDVNALAAYRSEHVFHMLTQSSRTMHVLKQESSPNPRMIMLREFKELPIKNEFRCFVYDQKLRAISQYHWNVEEPEFAKHRLLIRSRIDHFYKAVKELIPYKDCVMDLILLNMDQSWEGTFKNLGIYIVEFNCFGGELICGSALYNWYEDKDILYHNEDEPDIRIATQE